MTGKIRPDMEERRKGGEEENRRRRGGGEEEKRRTREEPQQVCFQGHFHVESWAWRAEAGGWA